MGRVLTNNTSLAYAIESTLGVLPGSPAWKVLEPNTISNFGATISTVARTPISKNRQRRKGTVTDLDSAAEFEHDWTVESFSDFIEGFAFASSNGVNTFFPTAVTSTGYTVPSGGALANGYLVYARGFATAANNGLKVLAGTSTGTEIKTSGLTAEASPPANVVLEVAGVRAGVGDLTIDAAGNLNSTTLNFTTLNLTVGQAIWIGGISANKFASAANTGFARITAITATKLTLAKKSTTFVVDAGTGVAIDLYFGRFVRNVPIDDGDYISRSFQFEVGYDELDNPSGDMYEYSKGNYCNEISFNLPLTDKATVTYGFIGTDTEVPTATRKTNASTAKNPLRTAALNTTADVARLRITEIDETGLTTDFKDLTLTIRNNVSPEKVIGNLGARYMNTGNFEVEISAELLFTDADVVTAIRDNRTVTMDFAVINDDGAIFVDIPSMTIGDGSKNFPVNESITIQVTASAFADPTLNTSIGVSFFPYVPGV